MNENYKNPQDGCMDWDDAIENDGQEFIILAEGDYNFTVTDFERGRFPGGPKVPPCNKATITMQVKTDDGIASIRTDLLLRGLTIFSSDLFFCCSDEKTKGQQCLNGSRT